MTIHRPTYRRAPLVAGLICAALHMSAAAAAGTVAIPREPAEGEMRLGQRVRVDDGTCPAGQVKEVTAAQLTPQGILRTRVCVKR
jgi:hypothetical protein